MNEKHIQEIGTKLVELARKEEAKLAKKHFWETALLDWCMENPELKTRAFRFIDVFPQLTSSRSVLNHIREYFPRREHRIPKTIRAGLAFTHPSLLTQGAVRYLTHAMFLKIAKLFIAASGESEVLRVLDQLDQQGMTCSIDLLGENTMSQDEAETYFTRYQTLIGALGKKKLGIAKQNISVKLSTLDPRFDPIDPDATSRRVREHLRELVRLARHEDVFIHIDMEEYEVRDLTLKIVRDLLAEEEFWTGVELGIVLQAYLIDADRTLNQILAWATSLARPITIRLVRGAYWDQEIMTARKQNWPIPVFTEKAQTDAMFEQLTGRLFDVIPKVRIALATHNIRSIAHAIALAEAKHVERNYFEFQLLYGMGAPLASALREMAYVPRIYMPIGDPVWGMAYLVRRLLENVSQQSFVRRGIHEKADVKQLLAVPSAQRLQNDNVGAQFIAPIELARNHIGRDESRPYVGHFEMSHRHDDAGTYDPCPPLRFFRTDDRQSFAAALESVRSQLGLSIPLVMGGKSIQKSVRIETRSPNDGVTPIANASKADLRDVEEAVNVAHQTFRSWAKTPVHERANYLRKTAQWMLRHRYELAAIQVYEVGKPWREADADVKEAIDFLNFYAYGAEQIQKDETTETLPDEINFTRPRPRGVAAVIAPWNFPLAIFTGMSSAALVTGNTVVLKPATQSVLTGWQLFSAYYEAGIPDGVVNFLSGSGQEIGPALVGDPDVAIVAFTGSKEVGLRIMAQANAIHRDQRQLKRCLIEMGGKNAAIVDETADFDQTIPAVLYSAFGYAGQKCSALSRLIVLDPIYESFVNRLARAASSFPFGNPINPETQCGPVIERAAQQRILSAIEEGRRSGRILFQADPSGFREGYYVPPTMICDLPRDSRLLREEIFGPVLSVIRVKTLDEAFERANETDYALTGGLFSRTPSHIERAKEEFEVGNLYINRQITGAIVGRHPFGGYNLSGTASKAGSIHYLREFYIERSVSENVSRHGFAPPD